MANLLVLGLDGFAQRIASVLPDIQYPSLRPGIDKWDERARIVPCGQPRAGGR